MPVEIAPSETAENPNPRTTWEGCSVLLDINDGDRLVFARLTPSTTVKIGDKKLSLRPLVGCPFGSLFRVETGPKGAFLARVVSTPTADDAKGEEFCVKDEVRDNRALVDNNKAQGLSGEDIDAMRREGATGDEIVEALIANSSTFENKTSFSQEKYRLRKQKKYAPKVLVRRPFARSICEAYFKKYPDRIGFLRVDTLSLLLSLANVSAYSDVLVVDMVGGIVTGAVAERLGGTGYVCNTHFGAKPYSTAIVRIFNFSREVCCRIVQSSFDDLSSAECNNFEEPIPQNAISSDTCSITIEVTKCTETDSARSLTLSSEENIVEGDPCHLNGQLDINRNVMIDCPSSSSNGTHETSVSPSENVCRSANPGRQASLEAIKSWKQNGFTSMIVAAPELDVESIIQDLLPLLSYSSPFAIYHQYLQPLANCMHKLQAGKLAINLQILEPWTREYQVLPSRTHPHMQMSAFGGYILSGIRTCSSVDCAQGN